MSAFVPGNICVPIDPAEVHNFDPNNVPTIHSLIEELEHVIVEDGVEHHSGSLQKFSRLCSSRTLSHAFRADWEQTSLKPYVQILDRHVQGLMRDVRSVNKGEILLICAGLHGLTSCLYSSRRPSEPGLLEDQAINIVHPSILLHLTRSMSINHVLYSISFVVVCNVVYIETATNWQPSPLINASAISWTVWFLRLLGRFHRRQRPCPQPRCYPQIQTELRRHSDPCCSRPQLPP